MSLMESDVPVRNVVTTDPAQAKALDNDLRAMVLDMLADEAMTVEAIQAELARRGEEKAETTVRHHVNVLVDAGLIELARLEEAGGGTRKYYRSNTRVFSYELPEDADETLEAAFDEVRADLESLVDDVVADHSDAIGSVARDMKPCEYCETQHYEEYVLRELVTRALTDLGEAGALEDVLE